MLVGIALIGISKAIGIPSSPIGKGLLGKKVGEIAWGDHFNFGLKNVSFFPNNNWSANWFFNL